MKSIKEIQEEFAAAPMESWPEPYEAYGQDSRKGVVNVLARCRRQEEKLQEESLRTERMKEFEKKYEHLGWVWRD